MTPYALSKASKGRISLSTAYRLARNKGVGAVPGQRATRNALRDFRSGAG